jgi:hypothetical protein
MARSGGLPTLTVVNDGGDVLNESTTLDDEDRTHVFAELPPELPEGRYTVIWHTVSDEDGEEAQGAFHFYVGAGPGETSAPASGTATQEATASPAPTNGGGDDDGGIPAWTLIVGVAGGLVAGGAAGVAFGKRRA